MDNDEAKSVFFWVLILLIGLFYYMHQVSVLKAENKNLTDENTRLTDDNDNLTNELNSQDDQIREAHFQAWSDYDTMGQALENLHTSTNY